MLAGVNPVNIELLKVAFLISSRMRAVRVTLVIRSILMAAYLSSGTPDSK